MLELKQKVLQFVQAHGPTIPSKVAEVTQTNLIFTSAFLSELAAQKQVWVTNTKVGGTPFYYVKGQEVKLQECAKHLSEKPRRAFELLREKRVVRDSQVEPWQRVALREIKDFSVRMDALLDNGVQETFWRWYLLSEEEAKARIRAMIGVKKEAERPLSRPKQAPSEEAQQQLQPEMRPTEPAAGFLHQVQLYLQESKALILEETVIKKQSEGEYLVQVPSPLGDLVFLVVAKKKKKISDADLKLAQHRGRGKPVLLVSTGELSKKAAKILSQELKGSVLFTRIGPQ